MPPQGRDTLNQTRNLFLCISCNYFLSPTRPLHSASLEEKSMVWMRARTCIMDVYFPFDFHVVSFHVFLLEACKNGSVSLVCGGTCSFIFICFSILCISFSSLRLFPHAYNRKLVTFLVCRLKFIPFPCLILCSDWFSSYFYLFYSVCRFRRWNE